METAIDHALAVSPFFQGCSLEGVTLTTREYPSGQILHDRPRGIPSVGMVVSGRIDVYSVAIDGRDVQLSSLLVGECFGICNLFTNTDLETVLRCAVDTLVLYLSKTDLLEILEKDSKLALRYAKLCNEKLQFLIGRIEQLTMQTCRGKMIAFLLAQKDAEGLVRLPFSKEDWAKHLCMSRAALFRELASLQQEGALSIQNGNLRVPDHGLLERLLYQCADIQLP